MSPVFRHGGLRLYLLKLLADEPRHGYDVIRLLQDRFLGVYSPSPGTIYPRLARLEEEGLVTHDVIDGKKVYRITDAGREELNRRYSDLEDLEAELSASVRDIGREISRDVRETMRSLRDELTWAVREAGRGANAWRGDREAADEGVRPDDERGPGQEQARGDGRKDEGVQRKEPATGQEQASRGREQDEQHDARTGDDWREWAGRRDWREWADWVGQRDWREWADWAGRHDWREWARWARRQDWAAWSGQGDWRSRASASPGWQESGRSRAESSAGAGPGAPGDDLVNDLERLANVFAREIRGVARQAEAMSADAVTGLGRILGDALNRITTEVFGAPDLEREEREEQARANTADAPSERDDANGPDAADESRGPDGPDVDRGGAN